jgi:hypothetical protein
MKSKIKSTSLSTQNQGKVNDRRQAFWRRTIMQLAAIFLIIVFLASECATILPVE